MPETVHILGEGGGIFELSLPLSEPIQDRLTKGYLTRVNADGTPFVEKVTRTAPPPYASKAEWVGWAVHASQGTADPLTPDDAEAFTKTDLIELYGAR